MVKIHVNQNEFAISMNNRTRCLLQPNITNLNSLDFSVGDHQHLVLNIIILQWKHSYIVLDINEITQQIIDIAVCCRWTLVVFNIQWIFKSVALN